MKVLWFANTPCSAVEKLGMDSHRGGWLKSLEHELSQHSDIDLNISFYAKAEFSNFRHNKTNYHPVLRKSSRSKVSRYLKRISGKFSNDAFELRQLLQVIDEVGPDIIHVHGTEDNFGLIQAYTKIPVVISIQGILTPYIGKFYAGVPAAAASRYERLIEKVNFKSASFLYKSMGAKVEREKEIFKQSRYIIGRTDWDRRVSRLLAPDSRYFYNSEILRASFYKASWAKTSFNDQFTIVTISSGALYKGFETIVQTATILSTYNNLDFQWIVIGLSETTGIVQLVKRMLHADLMELNVHVVGSKSESAIGNILTSADLYCQVSHIENSPNSLSEAMLTGMPVIASQAGGTSSLIENGKDGILIQDGDPHSLAGSILELANDFKTSSRYGANARQKAFERHDKTFITDGLIDIYNTVVEESGLTKPRFKAIMKEP